MSETVNRKKEHETYFATQVDFYALTGTKFKILGAWCAPVNVDVESHQLHFEVVNLLSKFEYDPQYIEELYMRLVPGLAQTLNKFHNLNLSNDQWESIFGYWLLRTLHPLHDRWRRLCSIASKMEDIKIIACLRSDNFNPAMTSMEDQRIEKSHEYNSYIYESMLASFDSMYLSLVNGPVPTQENEKLKTLLEKFRWKLVTLPSRIKLSILPALLVSCRFTKVLKHQKYFMVTSFIPFGAQLRLAIKSRSLLFLSYINNLVFIYAEPVMPKTNIERRHISLDNFNCTNLFETYLTKNLTHYIPKSLLEDFHAYVCTLEKYNLDYAPKSTISEMVHSSGSDLGRIWMGLYGNSDRQLIVLQHGGGYGHFKTDWSYYFESRVCSSFMSWGWAELYPSKKLFNAPALRLRSRKNAGHSRSVGILVLLPPEFVYPTFYYPWQPMDADQCINHLQVINQFLRELPERCLDNLYLKAQNTNCEFAHEVFSEKLDKINLLERGSSILLDSFKLLVSSYVGTHTVECLISNTPTIMLWSDSHCNFSENSVLIMQQLEEAGVLHKDFTSAARIASLDNADLLNWWNSKAVKLAVEDYLNFFGKVDGGPKIWAQEVYDVILSKSENDFAQS